MQTPSRPARGFSLIELMVSMAIGLVVIAAVLAAYLASGVSSRNTQAMAQINEDGNVALNVLRSHLAMVGYSTPTGVTGGGKFTLTYPGASLVGCDATFDDLSLDIGSLTCPSGEKASTDSIAIAYQADAFNSAVNTDQVPLDCVGNTLDNAAGYFLSYSRFYLSAPEGGTNKALYCRGAGSDTPQALVENIVEMQITYGVGGPVVKGENRRTIGYVDAADVPDFTAVVAVRICVVVASAKEVMDDETPYQPCDPFDDPVTPGDKRLYRTFTSTVALQNRLGAVL